MALNSALREVLVRGSARLDGEPDPLAATTVHT